MKKYLYTLMICFGLSAFAFGQTWQTLNSGLQGVSFSVNGFESIHYNGKLYVAYKDCSGGSGCNLVVKVWDGNAWSQLPTTSFGSSGGVDAIIGYNGSIYVAGGIHDLHQFDGSSWSLPLTGTGISLHFSEMDIHNNKLVGVGHVDNGGTPAFAIQYDGQNWTVYPAIPSNPLVQYAEDVKSINGSLYLIADVDTINNLPFNVFKWNGTGWDLAANNFYNPSLNSISMTTLASLNNRVYATDADNLYEIRNDSVILINSLGGSNFSPSDEVVFKGEIYFSGYSSGGNGAHLIKSDGHTVTQLPNMPATFSGYLRSLTTDGNLLYTTGEFSVSNGSGYNYAMATAGDVATLQGTVFKDDNANCSLDGGETPLGGALITINPGNVQVTTNQWGQYAVGMPAGSYTMDNVQLTNSLHTNASVASCNSLPMALSAATGVITQADVATEVSNTTDAAVVISGFTGYRARYGFAENYQLKVQNRGATDLQNLTAVLELPAGLSVSSATPNYTSVAGNPYTWPISQLGSLEEYKVTLSILIDSSVVNMGDSLDFTLTVNGSTGETDLTNNSDTLTQQVVGAIDPNDKHASAVSIEPGTSRLEYLINFQNTGTDTAYQVVIKDELESRLQAGTLEMISASHDYELQVEGQKLSWTFNNILLPDSGANYAGSQGFVKFSVGISPGLMKGDTLVNDADIFFDFQQPVHTDEARTAVVTHISLKENPGAVSQIEFYPNPAVDEIKILSQATETQMLHLIDMSGKRLDVIELHPGEEKSYSVQHLKRGFYLLKSETEAYRLIVK